MSLCIQTYSHPDGYLYQNAIISCRNDWQERQE